MPVQAQLPLTEATYFILLSLASGAKHGYLIKKDVEALSEGRLVMSTGTLYGALKRLLDQGWIERRQALDPGQGERERKAYRLTPLGRAILQAEVQRLGNLVAAAKLRFIGNET